MLEVRSVSVTYGKKIRALTNVSLTVKDKEIVALIGANGAGKSTLLKAVSGLLKVEEGEIFLAKSPLHSLPPHRVASLGVAHVPEGRRIFPQLTVEENLALGRYLNESKPKEQEDYVFHLFPLLMERKSQYGGTLSGGEQQMLAMARALMSDPKILMLDEPSMGLAPIYVDRIFETIRQINSRGMTILLVEQNAHQSLTLAHRGYVLENGKISMEGSGPDLLHNPLVQDAYLGSADAIQRSQGQRSL